MPNVVLVDTGPLVALLDRSDRHHAACRKTFESLTEPIRTVWPVISEAFFLLDRVSPLAFQDLLQEISAGSIELLGLDRADVPRMQELMLKYADLPMDLADAAIVSAAERENIETIFTIDRGDFSLYRPRHVKQFKLLP